MVISTLSITEKGGNRLSPETTQNPSLEATGLAARGRAWGMGRGEYKGNGLWGGGCLPMAVVARRNPSAALQVSRVLQSQ